MSVTKISMWLVCGLALLSWVPGAHAQSGFQPFAAPAITTDFQFFAPSEIETFGGAAVVRKGWFLTYDRVYMNVSRPRDQDIFRPFDNPNLPDDQTGSFTDGDFTWGNRFEFGFVNDVLKGWTATVTRIDGPNANMLETVERIDRVNAMGTPGLRPRRDQNDINTEGRDYILNNSINNGKLSTVEFNRTWTWKPLNNGGTLSPFIGFRYSQFTDFHRRQFYERFDANGLPISPTAPQVVQVTAVTERRTQVNSGTTNDQVGGQIGIRWSKPVRRWKLYGDFKMFGMQNFQNWDQRTLVEQTEYPMFNMGPPIGNTFERDTLASNSQEFTWGGEIRQEAQFEVTRDFALRAGVNILYQGQGVGRGPDPNRLEEDLLMFGFTFGGTLNR